MSHAVQGHPRRTGHSGELWQNVVHWRREWQTTPAFAGRTPCAVWKGKKIWHWKMSTPRSEGVQFSTGEEQRVITNSSRKNEAAGPKRKWRSVVDASASVEQTPQEIVKDGASGVLQSLESQNGITVMKSQTSHWMTTTNCVPIKVCLQKRVMDLISPSEL